MAEVKDRNFSLLGYAFWSEIKDRNFSLVGYVFGASSSQAGEAALVLLL